MLFDLSSGRGGRAAALLFVALLVLGLSGGCTSPEGESPSVAGAEDVVARGEYLVTVGACADCHTPLVMGPEGPMPDPARWLSGHPAEAVMGAAPVIPAEAGFWMWSPHNTAFVGPWGTSYAINLTPDENTGIGIWTEEIFVNTLRSGRHWGVARPILPPMPWPNYSQMTDEDLRAIYAYLRTVPPLSNRVPEAVLAPPSMTGG
jgi:mono/diheme cytochrome c family protein